MKARYGRLLLIALLLLGGCAGSGGLAAPGSGTMVYHIPLLVHVGESSRPLPEFVPIFAEINAIWLEQAGICFEITAVRGDEEGDGGLEMWFRPDIGGLNGSYDGETILMKDRPELAPAPHPARHPAARTAAHELGHVLGLAHDQRDPDNLMHSKTYGYRLSPEEISRSRQAAAALAQPDHPAGCAPPRLIP